MNRKKIFACLFALVLVVAASATMLAPSAESLPSKEVMTTYFADPGKTQWIGVKILSCYGGVQSVGSTSSYYTRTETPCY